MLELIIGKLHVLILHIPIGVLLLAVTFEWLDYWKWVSVPRKVMTWSYGIGTTSAILACISGYVLSNNGDYNLQMIEDHKWAGIITTVVALGVFYCSWKKNYAFQRWLSSLILIGIAIAGHLGGSITHGENYFSLSPKSDEYATPQFVILKVQNTTQLYTELIQPILKAKCVGCHGPDKVKGKLRLDDPSWILKKGKSGNPIISIANEESELLRRIHVSLSDDDRMPPKQKNQLDENEVKLITEWITSGGSFDEPISNFASAEKFILLGNIIINDSGKSGNFMGTTVPAVLPETKVDFASTQDIENLHHAGIVALNAGAESPFLELNCINVQSLDEGHWQLMAKVAPNITKLKLSHHPVTDEHLSTIAQMNNLLSLYIDHTNITDDGISVLSGLAELRYLNLNDTQISDKGIRSLLPLTKLEKLYVYNTEVEMDSLSPDLQIIKGGYDLPFLPSDTIRIPEN